jgi:cysteinyl-tRNA synthetase
VLGGAVAEADRLFHEAMDDDFNSARALGHLFDLSREINRALDERREAEARPAAAAMLRLGGVLGLFWRRPKGESWPDAILALAEEREAARKSRDWARADELRGRLAEQGVLVEDGPEGPKLKRKG